MLKFYQKRSWRVIVYSPIVLAFLVILCLLMARAVYERYIIDQNVANKQAAAEAVLQTLNQRKDMLQKKVNYLSNDRGIEAEMRRDFDVTRPGEKVVIILNDTHQATSTIEPILTSQSASTTRPWYKFW